MAEPTPPAQPTTSVASLEASTGTEAQVSPPVRPTSTSTTGILALVFGILSLLCCGFFSGIPAIILGRVELKAIEQGRSAQNNQPLAKIGMICGIIGSVLSCLGLLVYLGVIAFAIIVGQNTPTTF